MQNTRIGKNTVWYDNAEEFGELKKEIFTMHRYYAELDKEDPVILDIGAHIGLATLYIKQIYPEAIVTAFEPHPDNFELLKKNISENQLTNVTLVNAAIAPKSGKLTLHEARGSGEWRSGVGVVPGGWRGVQQTQPIVVEAVSILEYLHVPIDLMKMDIEGMEYEVLSTAGERLRLVKQLIFEVHPRTGKRFSDLERNLVSLGFKLDIQDDNDRLGKGLKIVKANRK